MTGTPVVPAVDSTGITGLEWWVGNYPRVLYMYLTYPSLRYSCNSFTLLHLIFTRSSSPSPIVSKDDLHFAKTWWWCPFPSVSHRSEVAWWRTPFFSRTAVAKTANNGNTRRGNLVSLIAVAHPVPALAGGGEVSPEDLSTLYAG